MDMEDETRGKPDFNEEQHRRGSEVYMLHRQCVKGKILNVFKYIIFSIKSSEFSLIKHFLKKSMISLKSYTIFNLIQFHIEALPHKRVFTVSKTALIQDSNVTLFRSYYPNFQECSYVNITNKRFYSRMVRVFITTYVYHMMLLTTPVLIM